MSIIEAIKNGAKFRHKDGAEPKEWAVLGNNIAVLWHERKYLDIYNDDTENIELIPEEEELWVAVSKEGKIGNVIPYYYKSTNFYHSDSNADQYGKDNFGPGNYTIHKITRTK